MLKAIEIDHTPLDLFVIDDMRGTIERPYLKTLVDSDSRMILGWEISFQPLSKSSARQVTKTRVGKRLR